MQPGAQQRITTITPGAVRLVVHADIVGTVRVVTDPTRTTGEVIITASADAGSIAADMVRNTHTYADGATLVAKLPPLPPGTSIVNGQIVYGSTGGSNLRNVRIGNVTIGNSTNVQIGHGNTQTNVFNGPGMHGSHTVNTAAIGDPPITVVAILPAGSSIETRGHLDAKGDFQSIDASSTTGRITHEGTAVSVAARSVSGNVAAGAVRSITADTTSGDITVEHVHGSALLKSVSGSVIVHGDDDAQVNAETVSGAILHGSNLRHARYRSVSGWVTSEPPRRGAGGNTSQ